jgi:hypothetical protein
MTAWRVKVSEFIEHVRTMEALSAERVAAAYRFARPLSIPASKQS